MALNVEKEGYVYDVYDIPSAKPKFLEPIANADTSRCCKSDEIPIFCKRKINLDILQHCGGKFIHMSVCKNWIVCVLQAPDPSTQVTLLKFSHLRTLRPEEVPLEKYITGYKISKLFLDPTGHHILISLVPKSANLSSDFLYINAEGMKVRRIEKFKGHEITALAFNKDYGTESSTGPILLGTYKGLIFETELTMDADKPSYRNQVYDLGLGRLKYPITGLEFYKLPNTNQYIVVIATSDCIFTFQETLRAEDKSLHSIFNSYINGKKPHGYEVVKTDLNYSQLRFYEQASQKYPTNWGWLCGSGLRHGQVAQTLTDEKFLLGEALIPLCKDLEQRKHLSFDEKRLNVPKSFVLTEYHALLMYQDHITGICMLNEAVIYEEYFHEQMGKLLNILRDPFTGYVYCYTDKMIFSLKITNESRNIWKVYLNMGLYEMAEIHAIDNYSLNKVLETKATKAFGDKNYIEAAHIYAETELAFDEICLKFIDLEEKRPIISYVKKKMDKLPNDADEQLLVMVFWLIDLYLTQINLPGRNKEEKLEWQKEYDDLMLHFSVIKCVRGNRASIQELISQHADPHNLAQFAIAHKDYKEVIEQHILAEKYLDALHVLRKQSNIDLYYQYCPILIEEMPKETVEVLMDQGRKFEISKLIPTLIAIDSPLHISEITKYLEYAIYNLGEINQAIHNFLLRLYCEHQPDKVMKYLENEGTDSTLIHYDIIYALSVCLDFGAKTAAVFLYCVLELWSAAVDISLEFDLKLAKETASKPMDDELKSSLWIKIACHEIKDKSDVKKALDLLKECELLKIEDLLPFFSDFEKIDDFKEPICKSLKEYNKKIQELEHDMEECSKQAERTRNYLKNIRERCLRIDENDVCNNCNTFLLLKPFFIFGCSHKFHGDCLEKLVVPLLSSERYRKLNMLKHKLEAMLTQSAASGESTSAFLKKREKLKQEIEEIIVADCVYCGVMIDTIDQPFVEDWEQVNVDWE